MPSGQRAMIPRSRRYTARGGPVRDERNRRPRRPLGRPRLGGAPCHLDGVDRFVHRAVDPRQDRRPDPARQRRAEGAVRRAVAADVLADRRHRQRRGQAAARVSRRSVADEDLSEVVSELSKRGVNYAEEEAPPHAVAGWHQDHVQVALGQEEPGKIAENGLASSAAELVNSYEFADPAILRAVYRYPD